VIAAAKLRLGVLSRLLVATRSEQRAGFFVHLLIIGQLLDPVSTRADLAAAPQPAVRRQPVPTLHEGYRRYQGVCGHCHGPDGMGSSFAPSRIDPLPIRDRFIAAVLEGVAGPRGVMRGFAGDPNVEPYLEAIYAYLADRAAGRLGRGRPECGPVSTGC
jgi:mono/diheme cytochrome c family protein